MDRFARWLARRPLPALVAIALVTVLLGIPASRLRIENSLESVLPAGDPAVEYYNQTRAAFGSDDIAVVGVLADDVFAASTLEKIARVTNALAKVDGVEWVVSITNAPDLAANPGFTPPPLLPRIPPTPDELEAFKRRLAATPLLGENFVSDDFRGAAINVFFKNLTAAQYLDLGIDERIVSILAEAGGPERFFYTGAGHLTQVAVGMIRRDLVRFTPIALLLMLVVLWLSFR